jgi:hypothetical protein
LLKTKRRRLKKESSVQLSLFEWLWKIPKF